MKKLGILALSFLFSNFFMVGVSAITINTDTENKIDMPYNLYLDKTNYIDFKDMAGATKFYQIVDVTENKEITDYIDEYILSAQYLLYQEEEKFNNLENGSLEAEHINSNMLIIKGSISDNVKNENFKTLINDDPNETKWIPLTENIIPIDDITKNRYYIVWIKAVNNGTPIYEYHAYKAINSDYFSKSSSNSTTEVENPDTGIEHTILFVTVSTLILVGSGLVVNRNKESY